MTPSSCHPLEMCTWIDKRRSQMRYLYGYLDIPMIVGIPSQSPLLQTHHAQLLPFLLIKEMLQTSHHLCGFHWALSRSSLSFWNCEVQSRTQRSRCGPTRPPPCPADRDLPEPSQACTGLLALPHGQAVTHQDSSVPAGHRMLQTGQKNW